MQWLNPHNLPRRAKRLILLGMDGVLIPFTLYLANCLRYGTLMPPIEGQAPLFALILGLGLIYVVWFRLPWIKLNAFEDRAITKIGLVAVSLSVTAMALSYLLQLGAPRSVPIIFGILFFFCAIGARIAALMLLSVLWAPRNSEIVAVYGAGQAGIQLAAALRQSREARAAVFVDDNPALWGLLIAGVPVVPPAQLARQIDKHKITRVLLAMPSVDGQRLRGLVTQLSELPVTVQSLPSYIDIMSGRVEDTLRPVSPDALLGRDTVDLDIPAVAKAYAGRVVLVTGAGGSIGSELSRQLLRCRPARVVLCDHAEYNLYAVTGDLTPLAAKAGIPLTSRLGSVTDADLMARIMQAEGVEIVLHAAAYKHVPLVEDNVLVGVANNVLGTQVAAEAAARAGVERFILVSTDKAVRPTNVMGASKRMAELVVQGLQLNYPGTCFAMVRFGNVLGSSGSVLPLFQKQIAEGGPVTVTPPEVTRYFMTIPEAARLVLLAGAYAKGRDLFVLDMGKPQKIYDIAERMIALSGRKVMDPATGKGDIEIKIVGLRPGEKLYEELLIDDTSLVATPHPKIMRAEEAQLSQLDVARMMQVLSGAIAQNDPDRLLAEMHRWVEGYQRSQPPAALPG